ARKAVNDLDGAIADYDQALRLNPQLACALNNRGTAWKAKGDLDRAMVDYSRAIRLDERYAVPYLNRGIVHLLQGREAEAEQDFSQALKLDADLQPAFEKMVRRVKGQSQPHPAADNEQCFRYCPLSLTSVDCRCPAGGRERGGGG